MRNLSKYSNSEAKKYWLKIHIQEVDDLKSVCFPQHSIFFNRFFDYFQKFAIRRALNTLQISVSGKKILDIGCGRGRWIKFYNSLGGITTGVDLSPEAINKCREKGLQAIQCDITELPFKNNTFDIVNSVTVLHHIPYEQQKRVVSELYRVLKPQGWMIMLECTSSDPAPHMFSRKVEEWETLFKKFKLVFCEGHYYTYLIRLFWKIPLINRLELLENIVVAFQIPIEKYFLKRYFSKRNHKALQHLMVFYKSK